MCLFFQIHTCDSHHHDHIIYKLYPFLFFSRFYKSAMDGHYPHHLHQQQQQELHQFQLQQQFQVLPPQQHHHHLSPPITVHVDASDRFPQWSIQETKELITIRAELDQTFMETKRNKQLWEVIATKMKDKGHNRSAEQCKCKWKNLVTRYKVCYSINLRLLNLQNLIQSSSSFFLYQN